jgi:hypothetical protein
MCQQNEIYDCMENVDKLTINSLLGIDGFVPYIKSECGDNNVHDISYDRENIYEMLHAENPILKLKEFGMFSDKNNLKYDKLEYTNIYDIDTENNYARYLLSRTYLLEKEIKDDIITIEYGDISFTCPLYYLSITDDNNNTISEELYIVELNIGESDLIVWLNDGYVKDDNHGVYDMFGRHYAEKYNEIIKPVIPDRQCIFNSYTDKITIYFSKDIKAAKIKIECKVYDIYNYGGFFRSGWMFS